MLGLVFSGCARKTKVEKYNDAKIEEQGLVIGSFSRNTGKVFFRESSIVIYDLNMNFVKSIFTTGKEVVTDLRDPFRFEDDFKYENSNGSVFSFYLPEGEYIISNNPCGFLISTHSLLCR